MTGNDESQMKKDNGVTGAFKYRSFYVGEEKTNKTKVWRQKKKRDRVSMSTIDKWTETNDNQPTNQWGGVAKPNTNTQ